MLSLCRLIVAWSTLFVIGTDLFVVSPLIPLIADGFQVSARSAGLTVTAFAWGYVVAAPIFGHLADRVGRRRVLTWCLVIFSAANLLTAAVHNLPAMMAARLLCGIAAAGITPSIYVLTGTAAPVGQRGTWIAIVLTGLLSSLPLGAPIGAMASLTVGWPAVFICLAACSLVLAPIHQGIWPATQKSADTPAGPEGVGPEDSFSAMALARHLARTAAWSTALYGMYTFLGAGLTSLGYTPGAIAEIVFIYGAAAFGGALLGGRIADRLGPVIAIRISLIGMSLCFMLLQLAVQHGVLMEVAFGMTSLLAQMFFPAQQTMLLNAFPTRNSTALSWNNSALFLGIALGSLIGGQAMAFGGFTAILPIAAAITLAGWVGCVRSRLRSQRPRDGGSRYDILLSLNNPGSGALTGLGQSTHGKSNAQAS
jgi:predicted MFS family arabinose efflux permease